MYKDLELKRIYYLNNLPDNCIISLTDAALLLNKSPETIRRWRHQKVGPPHLAHPTYRDRVEYEIGAVRNWIFERNIP